MTHFSLILYIFRTIVIIIMCSASRVHCLNCLNVRNSSQSHQYSQCTIAGLLESQNKKRVRAEINCKRKEKDFVCALVRGFGFCR